MEEYIFTRNLFCQEFFFIVFGAFIVKGKINLAWMLYKNIWVRLLFLLVNPITNEKFLFEQCGEGLNSATLKSEEALG